MEDSQGANKHNSICIIRGMFKCISFFAQARTKLVFAGDISTLAERAHQRMLEQTMTLYVQNVNINGTIHLKDLSPLKKNL